MSALDTQVGDNHYKQLAIEPVEYNHANNLGFCEGNVVKYVTRWRDKNGMADLEKAKHYIELLIQLETSKLEKAYQGSPLPEGVVFKPGPVEHHPEGLDYVKATIQELNHAKR
jgi:hypothetical protein